jgi:hypothetical protein
VRIHSGANEGPGFDQSAYTRKLTRTFERSHIYKQIQIDVNVNFLMVKTNFEENFMTIW